MNGRRVKALRKAFRNATGEAPPEVEYIGFDKSGAVKYRRSVWRRLKKDYKLARRKPI